MLLDAREGFTHWRLRRASEHVAELVSVPEVLETLDLNMGLKRDVTIYATWTRQRFSTRTLWLLRCECNMQVPSLCASTREACVGRSWANAGSGEAVARDGTRAGVLLMPSWN